MAGTTASTPPSSVRKRRRSSDPCLRRILKLTVARPRAFALACYPEARAFNLPMNGPIHPPNTFESQCISANRRRVDGESCLVRQVAGFPPT